MIDNVGLLEVTNLSCFGHIQATKVDGAHNVVVCMVLGIVRILSRYDRCWVRADILGGDGGTLACGVDAWLGYVGQKVVVMSAWWLQEQYCL